MMTHDLAMPKMDDDRGQHRRFCPKVQGPTSCKDGDVGGLEQGLKPSTTRGTLQRFRVGGSEMRP
eukprot:6504911-Pyramimonas_sp.AAC.1